MTAPAIPPAAASAEPDEFPDRAAWAAALSELYRQVEAWVGAWDDAGTRQYLGPGALPRLLVHTPGGKFMFSPAGGPGADGLVDYYLIPSLESVMLVRSGGTWSWHEPSDDPTEAATVREWNREEFRRATDLLERAGADA